jgi:hypothetical protein
MIFAFVMPDITDGNGDVNDEGSKVSVRGSWAKLSAELDEKGSDIVSNAEGLTHGWYIPLHAASPDSNYLDEYVTIRPILSGGNMYIATFMQKRITNIDDPSATCDETGGSFTGNSRLYAISLENGRGLWDDNEKYREYEDVKIVNATDMGDSIAFGVEVLDPAALDPNNTGDKYLVNDDETLILTKLEKKPNGRETSDGDEESSNANGLPSGNESIINYWLYK